MALIRKRQSITFTDEAADLVENLAAKRGVSVSEVVREAIALEKWLQDRQSANEKILVKKDDEPAREVEFLIR